MLKSISLKNQKLKYFDLIKELAITGFKIKYQGSFLGYLWSLMKPLFLFIVLYFVFNYVFKLGRAIPHYPVYLLIGITLWGFFVETTVMCMTSIVSSGDLIRKIYFPRIVLPISVSLTSFITLTLNLVVVFGFIVFNHIAFSWNMLFLPLYLIEFYIFTLGVSLFLSALFVNFRDISPIWEVVSQTLFYATPILYAITLVSNKLLVKVMMLNPLAQIIQGAREALLGSYVLTSYDVLGKYSIFCFLLVALVFFIGYSLFQKMSAKFAEEV